MCMCAPSAPVPLISLILRSSRDKYEFLSFPNSPGTVSGVTDQKQHGQQSQLKFVSFQVVVLEQDF